MAAASWFLSWSGDAERAVALSRRMEQLSPADWVGPWNLGIVLNYAGRYDEASAALRKSIAIAPALPIHHSWLALTEVARGDAVSALRELKITEKLLGDDREIIYLLDMGYAYGRLGDTDNAKRLCDEIQRIAAVQDIGAGGGAIASLAIKDYDEALQRLRTGADKAARHEIDAGMFTLMNLRQNVTGDAALEQPEFIAVRERLKGD